MKKHTRIEALLAQRPPGDRLPAAYLGYFECFNRQEYYEAHDVLEHLWLQDRSSPDEAFYRGLIQLAGAFVHLQKQRARPEHPKDGRRLRPASRLFRLAAANLARYGPLHHSLNVEAVHRFCEKEAESLIASGYVVNPWSPERAPRLTLESDG